MRGCENVQIIQHLRDSSNLSRNSQLHLVSQFNGQNRCFLNYPQNGLVVQWTEQMFPKHLIAVRFCSRLPQNQRVRIKKVKSKIFTFFVLSGPQKQFNFFEQDKNRTKFKQLYFSMLNIKNGIGQNRCFLNPAQVNITHFSHVFSSSSQYISLGFQSKRISANIPLRRQDANKGQNFAT